MRSAIPPLLPLLLDDVPSSLATMLAQEGVPTAPFQPGRSNGTFVLHDTRGGRLRPMLTSHQQPIDLDRVRRSVALRTGVDDPFAPLAAGGTQRAAWQIGEFRASEEIAAVDRRALREHVISALSTDVERLGGVWMRVAPYPAPYRTVANFRFDHDEFVADDFNAALDAIAGREAMTTHFVCGATHEPHVDALRRLIGLDVGSHGYRHHTYRTLAENLTNLERGIDVLRRAGLSPSGFTAPHGRYNAGLAAALASLGITHSSEFGLAYDDLPFLPPGSDTLQLPIHPVCLGIVLEAAGADEAARRRGVEATVAHFLATAAALHRARLPILFYGHPDGRVGRYPELLRRVLGGIAELPEVWRTTMSEFQRWWRRRSRVELEVAADGRGWLVSAERLPKDFSCALEVRDAGRTATVLLDRARLRVAHGALEFEERESALLPVPTPVRAPLDLKAMIRRALDWERVTPIDEIDSARWTGLMKKTLRRIRG